MPLPVDVRQMQIDHLGSTQSQIKHAEGHCVIPVVYGQKNSSAAVVVGQKESEAESSAREQLSSEPLRLTPSNRRHVTGQSLGTFVSGRASP
jgi:hypothetical protein